MAKEKKLKEKKLFVRKHPDAGVYGICWKKRQIEIKNREIFSTDDKELIKVFKSDPEIMEFTPPEDEEGKESEVLDYYEMSERDLIAICKKRELVDEYFKVGDFSIEELVQTLKKYDKENSDPKNDPGEQTPDDKNQNS